MKRVLLASFLILVALANVPAAQLRVVPIDAEGGHVALGLALRHLANTGILMQTTAHPDDENNGLLVMMNRGQGYRTALATATRGNGGQNEIGPEIFEALGVLRTKELEALHRFDGAEQYFTRAVDFGFSFSFEETFEKWGRDEITADYVRLMRTIRPDVVIALMPGGEGGGQHHQASAIISRCIQDPSDAAKYPGHQNGLRAWQPKKFYNLVNFGFPGEPPPQRRVRGSASPATTRYSALHIRRSEPMPASCTNARGWRSSSPCRRRSRRRISSLKRQSPGRIKRTKLGCSTASTRASPVWRSLRARGRRRI